MSVLDDLVGHQLRRLQIIAGQHFATQFSGRDLTSIQVAILLRLLECREMPQRALARDTSVDATVLVGALKRLETKGLIQRSRPSQDLRTQIVKLTSDGIREAQSAEERIFLADDSLMQPLTPRERQALLLLLHKLCGPRVAGADVELEPAGSDEGA